MHIIWLAVYFLGMYMMKYLEILHTYQLVYNCYSI